MKIWIFSFCRNEERMLPWYLRHYERFAERILVWDDHSWDGSFEILKHHPKVTVYPWPYDSGLNDEMMNRFAMATAPGLTQHNKCDWWMWVDIDEFIYHPQMEDALDMGGYYDAIIPIGYNMMSANGLPVDDGKSQLTDLLRTGVAAPVYSKPVIVRQGRQVYWDRGRHHFENCPLTVNPYTGIKLLHYRYLGADYTRVRNARNYAAVGPDKQAAWSCAPDYKGEGSPEWVLAAQKGAFEVI